MIQAARLPHPAAAVPTRVLLVGDADGLMSAALERATPMTARESVATVFEAVIAVGEADFAAVLVNVEPVERRPEAAVRALRESLGDDGRRRLVLFGGPSLEPLSRRMLGFGGDDVLVMPADDAAVRRALQLTDPSTARPAASLLPDGLPLARVVLDALLERTGGAMALAVQRLDALLPPNVSLRLLDAGADAADKLLLVAHIPSGGDDGQKLALHLPSDVDEPGRSAARQQLDALAAELSKLAELDVRNAQLQKFALTDELTECYNRRYFNHFLGSILKKARRERFPVTLLMFDIDDFKQYNDHHGHALGDEILRQTSALIRRCVRDHDLVARIGGDEFAVVFWEKDAPRVPHDPDVTPSGRFPQGPLQIAARFRRLLAEPAFAALGQTGEGSLTISGGMAVYPFDAQSSEDLIAAADKALIFGAKRGGKNSIALVGDEEESV